MPDELVWYDAGKVLPPFEEAVQFPLDDDWSILSEEVLCKAEDRTVSRGQYLLTLSKDGELHGEWGSELCETNDDAPIVAWAFIPEEEENA